MFLKANRRHNAQSIFITNATTKTVTIDSTTSGSSPGTMTVSNLTLLVPVNATNTLFLNNAGTNIPLHVLNGFSITAGGVVTIANSALRVDGLSGTAFVVDGEARLTDGTVQVTNSDWIAGMRVGNFAGSCGTLTLAGGTLTVAAVLRTAGNAGSTGTIWVTGGNLVVSGMSRLDVSTARIGRMIVSNGTVNATTLIVGNWAGSQGTLTLAGGTTALSDVAILGLDAGATGQVWVTGGDLTVTNDTGQKSIEVGGSGVGALTVSSGVVRALQISAGSRGGSLGTLTIAGGTVTAGQGLFAGSTNTSIGAIWMTGGQLLVSNEFLDIGFQGIGQMIVSNGSVTATNMIVGDFAGSQGTLTMAGGTLTLSGFFNAGQLGSGTVWMTGGTLVVDQSPGNLFVVSNGVSVGFSTGAVGQMTVSNGAVLANPLAVGNGAGSVGTLTLVGGVVSVAAANPAIPSVMAIGNMAGSTGTVWVTGGQLLMTNSSPKIQLQIGSAGTGRLIVSNGLVQTDSIYVGTFPGGEGTLTVIAGTVSARQLRLGTNSNTRGTLNVVGGTFNVLTGSSSALLIGDALTATGILKVAGGQVIATNVPTLVGSVGVGRMDVSSGMVMSAQTRVGAGTNATGSLTMQGGTMLVTSNLIAAAAPGSTGVVALTGGFLTVTNGTVGIGSNGEVTDGSGVGTMTVSNATVTASTILLGSSAGGQGELTLADGGLIGNAGSNCVLVVNDFNQVGGGLVWSNGTMYCGYSHPGAYTLSNGTAVCQDVYIGYDNAGSMTVAGGAMDISSRLTVGHLGPPFSASVSTGAVWIIGGQLTMTNLAVIIGNSGVGQLSISNGSATAATVVVGNGNNAGTLTLAGGTLTVDSLVLTNPTSRFAFSGGWLNAKTITNANGQTFTVGNGFSLATLNLQGGFSTLGQGLTVSAHATLSGFGTVAGNVLNFGYLSAGNGALNFTGGTVTNYGTIVALAGGAINFNGPVVNYGVIIINNAIHFNAGLINNGALLDPAGDADGDGMNNLQEVLAGTQPLDSASVFRILSIGKEDNDLRVTWSSVGGKRYVVQAASVPGGGYTTNFTDICLPISVSGVGEFTSSYSDVNAATNAPDRYYRVRLAQ